MSKKANPTSIGLFFAVGVALGLAGLLLFSSRSFFHPQQKTIIYFDSSLKGLNPGAPVKYRGVTIGSVFQIFIRHNQSPADFSMPVLIKIDKTLAQSKSDEALQIGDPENLKRRIEHGMRARLDSESLVTGILYVDIEVISNAPPPVFHQLTPEYHEIPSVPSDAQKLLAELSHMDVSGLSKKLSHLLAHLDDSLGELDVASINEGVTNLLLSANRFVTDSNLTNAVASLRDTLDQAKTLVKRIDGRVDPLANSANDTLAELRKTLGHLRVGLQNVSNLIGSDSTLGPELTKALQDLGAASRSITDLADFLQRHPNSLLTGRKITKEQP